MSLPRQTMRETWRYRVMSHPVAVAVTSAAAGVVGGWAVVALFAVVGAVLVGVDLWRDR